MKGSKKVIDILNEALAGELVAITQYFMHSEMQRNWGYTALADHLRKEAMDEMTHAQKLTSRILFLEGVPTAKSTQGPKIGKTIPEQLQNDLALELHAVQQLNSGIMVSRLKGDNTSAELLGFILAEQEEHVRWLQTQLGLIQRLGESNYLLSKLGD